MIIQITLKDPDGVADAIKRATDNRVEEIAETLTDEEAEDCREGIQDRLEEDIKPWVEWGEYVTIELDTETKTARVVPRG